MDIQLVALIGLILAVLILGTKYHSRSWPGRPGWQYQRVISFGFGGMLFLVTGLIGWSVSRHDAFVTGTHWHDGPIWWQVYVGAALLLLAGYWARRVPRRVAR